MTIDLGRKYDSTSATLEASPKAATTSYPSLNVTLEKPLKLPGKEFEAGVTLVLKRSEVSEDERGKKRCSYTFDVVDLTPGKCCDDSEEEAEEMDASSALRDSMDKARKQKMDDTEED